jgi:hypothetical protein
MNQPKPHNYRIGSPKQNCMNCTHGRSIYGAPIPGRPLWCHYDSPARRVSTLMVCDQWKSSDQQQEIDL